AVGQAKYVLICDSDGGIINDPVLTRMDENTFWFALASSDALLFARGLKNAYPDVHVTIREADVAPLQIQGPKSKDLMIDLLGEEIGKLKYYYWTSAEIAGAPVVVTRTGWTSEVGYEVYLTDTTKGTEVYEAIMKAGGPYGLRPTGPSDIRRIEGAIFNWGADMTYENNAFELGLDRLVDFDLDDSASISMAAYRRIQQEGVANKINGLVVEGPPFPALNNTKWPVSVGNRVVGKVTSAIYSPRLAANIGYAWLPVDNSREGQRVRVETEWGGRAATVTPMPFVDPQKKIPLA
ncbi:MAG TPA: glycine cleavage T C-terminal barrel domain-containing protein, partial [Acidimicrobiia bacterium]|nr:glycine cleavage T C-terminal barrel domain-containing protein [Acidimicrobiia bacterium]